MISMGSALGSVFKLFKFEMGHHLLHPYERGPFFQLMSIGRRASRVENAIASAWSPSDDPK